MKIVNIRATLKESERFQTMSSPSLILPASACESVKNERFETCLPNRSAQISASLIFGNTGKF